jgi:HK97 family phage major capsid protein
MRKFLEQYGFRAGGSLDDANDFLHKLIADGRIHKKDMMEWLESGAASGGPSAAAVFGGGSDNPSIEVKDKAAMFSTQKTVGVHAKTGQPVVNPFTGAPAELPSKREYAVAGAYFRWLARRCGVPCRPLEGYEKSLLLESASNEPWAGCLSGDISDDRSYEKGVHPDRVKTLLSDSTSGGVALNPLWFDTAIITFPLLSGELFPFVDVVEMPRGSLVNTASIQNVQVTWGQADATSIPLYNTAGLVALINPTVQNMMVAVEVGRDLLSDAAVDVGQYLVQIIGERFSSELDRVIASGDGVTQPQGIFNSSNATIVNSDYGTFGPLTIGDVEGLVFSSPKQYRNPQWQPSFVMSDVTYRRARAIPIGPGDERRLFGLNHQEYKLLEYPVRVSQYAANNQVAFMPLKKFRLWRRMGVEVRWTIEGQTLGLKNTAILFARARYAGRVVDATGLSLMSDTAA